MQKNNKKRKLIVSGIMILGIILSYNILLKSNDKEKSHNLIAMFVQNEEGEYELKTTKEFPKEGYVLNTEKSVCKNGGILTQNSETKKISLTVSNKEECTLYFDKINEPSKSKEILEYLNLQEKSETPDFRKTATTDETADGLYAMDDDYGTSYYFRGAAKNNYVKFGKNADGQDMWWRIIRINGDGSLRMQYDGTKGWANGTANDNRIAIANKAWNTQSDDAKYVGWMFGGAQGEASTSYEEATRNETNSEIKTLVDNWYVENIKNTGYSKYLSDELFCNDRTAYTDSACTTPGNGYGKLRTYYGRYIRLGGAIKVTPSFKCPQKNDMFTLKDGASPEVRRGKVEGNKALDYPVGLITADEINAAGGVHAYDNTKYYLYQTTNYFSWSLSPDFKSSSLTTMFINNSGLFNNADIVLTKASATPVINLSVNYTESLKGNGTIDNPYELNI